MLSTSFISDSGTGTGIGSMSSTRRGGAREGAGRKKLTPEQIEARDSERRQILIDELIFPAVCTAFHADPGTWNDRHLTFQLSTVQIVEAYGQAGLVEWRTYFRPLKKGGRDRNGIGFKTVWVLNANKYSFVLALIKSLGHTPKKLPAPGFPPEPMLKRLAAVELKKRIKRDARSALSRPAALV